MNNQPDIELNPSAIVVSEDVLPPTLYIFPLAERPFFPPQTLPLLIDEEPWRETMEIIGDNDHHYAGLVATKGSKTEDFGKDDFYSMGTIVRIHHPASSDGKIQFIAEGLKRFVITRWISDSQPFLVQVQYPKDRKDDINDELRAYAMAIINSIKELMPLNPLYSEELKFFLKRFGPNEPHLLTDFAASLTTSPKEELQSVLEADSLIKRMEKVLLLLKKELEVAKLQAKIRENVEHAMNDHQRKFFLREQLKAIQQELGIAKDDKTADQERFQSRLDKLNVPLKAREVIDEELDKLRILETGSPEYGVTRNYLDMITSLPWGKYSEDKYDLVFAKKILNKHHDGLEDVKERILEFISVGALKGEVSGSILLLVGPPGVGKTSIGRSVAEAIGRKFYRFSLGGMRDEAEIKGHRRTYIGAMPGKFIQAIKETGVANPVIMLDEVDKIGNSYLGDPASSLLEVLDPEQNSDFLDHYLDMRFDLSKVLFICTANQLDTIPSPLLDRMEIISLAGYISQEKMAIAKNHLLPRLLERNGLKKNQIKIKQTALRQVIEGYAREAGVRNLEKKLAKILRKAGVKLLQGEEAPIVIEEENLLEYLGQALFRQDQRQYGVGICTGLAWTAMGGATLNIEASLIHSKRAGFKITGQLGDVMRESAEIAHSYICANLQLYEGAENFFDEAFVHVHVPEGATPKDGPSAGITMASALLSLARNQPVKRQIAMTGELTLTGQVLAVGGIREKLLAAKRNGLKELILPTSTKGDVEQIPDNALKGLQIHFVEHYKEVVELIFNTRKKK